MHFKLRPSQFCRHRLANGLEIIAECHPEAYAVGLGLFVSVGARDEPSPWAGISHFVEHMVFKGNAQFPSERLNDAFERIGALYNAITDEDSTNYFLAVLPEYWPEALELLGQLMQPDFPPDQLELERRVILEEIRMDEDEPPYNAEDICRRIFFGDHPLGNSILGSKQSVAAIQAQDLHSYFQAHYGADTAVLVATGRINFDELVAKAEKIFGGWSPCGYRRQIHPVVPQQRFVVIPKPGSHQQYFLHLAPAPTGLADWVAVWLLTAILGGQEGGRLHWEFVDPGLVETVDLWFEEHQGAAVFAVSMTCEPTLAEENCQRLWDFYRRVREEPIHPQELEWAKNKVSSGLVLASELSVQRLANIGHDWLLERRYYSVAELLEMVAAVSPERILQLVHEYPFDCGTLVTVGPLEELSAPAHFPAEVTVLSTTSGA